MPSKVARIFLCAAVAIGSAAQISAAQLPIPGGNQPQNPTLTPESALMAEFTAAASQVFANQGLPAYAPLFIDQDVIDLGVTTVSGTTVWSSEQFVIFTSIVDETDLTVNATPAEAAQIAAINLRVAMFGGTILTGMGNAPFTGVVLSYDHEGQRETVIWLAESLTTTELSDFAYVVGALSQELAITPCKFTSPAREAYETERRLRSRCAYEALHARRPWALVGAVVTGAACGTAIVIPNPASWAICAASAGWVFLELRHQRLESLRVWNSLVADLSCACTVVTQNPFVTFEQLLQSCPLPPCP